MPKRKPTEAPPISLYARVDSHEVRSSFGFNVFLLGRRHDHIAGDSEVFESTTQLIVRGILSDPIERLGERIEVTLHGQKIDRSGLCVKDVHARDKNENHLYRSYRGGRAPVLD